MNPIMAALLSGVTISAGVLTLAAPSAARAGDTPKFVAARYDATASVVLFESPVEIDWEAKARKHFKMFDFERPTTKDIAYLRERIWEISGDTEEKFSFAPPRGWRAMSYVLISARGIEPLRVARLEGTISFDFDQSQPPAFIGVRHFSGEAASQRGVRGGGFALLSRHAAPPKRIDGAVATVARGADGVTLSYADAEGRASITYPAKWHGTFETAFGLRVAGRRYLFIDWPPDTANYDAGCQDSFFLYEVGKTLTLVATNDYNCDV